MASSQPANKIASTSKTSAGIPAITTLLTTGPGTSTATAPFHARVSVHSTACLTTDETGGTEDSSRRVSPVPTNGLAFHSFLVSKLSLFLFMTYPYSSLLQRPIVPEGYLSFGFVVNTTQSKIKLIDNMPHFDIFHLLIPRSDSCHRKHRLLVSVLRVRGSPSIQGSPPPSRTLKLQGGHVEAFGSGFLRKYQ